MASQYPPYSMPTGDKKHAPVPPALPSRSSDHVTYVTKHAPKITIMPDGSEVEESVEEITDVYDNSDDNKKGSERFHVTSNPDQNTMNFPSGTKPSVTSSRAPASYPQTVPAPSAYGPAPVLGYHNEKERGTKKDEKRSGSFDPFFCCRSLLTCLCCGPMICCGICILMLVALALTTFFLWPRIPRVEITGVNTTQLPAIAGNRLTSIWSVNMTVESRNYIDWRFEKVESLVLFITNNRYLTPLLTEKLAMAVSLISP